MILAKITPPAVQFLPHHVLCTLGFEGKGYSPRFVKNYAHIKKHLTADTPIQIMPGLDAICAACPNHNNNVCQKETLIQALDNRHKKALNLTYKTYTWNTLIKKVKSNIEPSDLQTLCRNCAWLPLGVCANAVAKLKTTTP